MTTPNRFSRRSMFQSLGSMLLLAPILRSESALAQSKPIRRFIALFHPNGSMYLGGAAPSGAATGFSFGSYYQALERHRAETIAFTGLRIGGEPYGTQAGVDGGHGAGGWGCLTCTSSKNTGHATGPSIDQFIARKLNEQGLAPTPRAPVFRVGPGGGGSPSGVWRSSSSRRRARGSRRRATTRSSAPGRSPASCSRTSAIRSPTRSSSATSNTAAR